MANNYLHVGSISGLAYDDLEIDFTEVAAARRGKTRPGQIYILTDDFGEKIVRFVRNLSGSAFAQGDLVRRVAVVSVNNITSGTTTSATLAAGFTVGSYTGGKHVGMMLYVVDNDDSAGAAPENEVSIIVSNTTSVGNVDPDLAYTAALAANDDLRIKSPGWHAEDSVAADLAVDVIGVIIPSAGITDGNYGFAQIYGNCVIAANLTGETIAANEGLIAAAKSVAADADAGAELIVGYSPFAMTSDSARDKLPIFLKLFSPYLNIGTP